ncbi:MAG: TIGR04283 family arsenosugar biosynthesis glycosyltransferase [Pseudomonadota bacterium]
MEPRRLSVVIPTLNAEHALAKSLAALDSARASGFAGEVVVVDGGSVDGTLNAARRASCRIVEAPTGRGAQLAAGADAATGEFLLFLHADTTLEAGWEEAAARFMAPPGEHARAGAFRFRFDEIGAGPALVAFGVRVRCALFKLPFGDQGLLISRRFYDALGGFRPMALMEDVDLVRRIGRHRLHMLKPAAITSAERYRRLGYARRVLRNWKCLALYYRGASPEDIMKVYER